MITNFKIFEQNEQKDKVKETYNTYRNLCNTIANFINSVSNKDVSNVIDFWYDKKFIALYNDALANESQYEFSKYEYKELLKYLKENSIKGIKKIQSDFNIIIQSIQDFMIYSKIIEENDYILDLWYNDENEFEVEYQYIKGQTSYVFDNNEYNSLLDFINNPEMYKDSKKYNL